MPMLTAYSASKFAIRGLTQAAGKLLLPGSSMWMDAEKLNMFSKGARGV